MARPTERTRTPRRRAAPLALAVALLLLASCGVPEPPLSPASMTGPYPSFLPLTAAPGDRASGVFEVGNGGTEPLTVDLRASDPWLTVEGPAVRRIGAGGVARVRVSALCAAGPDRSGRAGSVTLAGDDPRRREEHVLVRLLCERVAEPEPLPVPVPDPVPDDGGNAPPRAEFAADPPSGSAAAPAEVTFTAAGSRDADGTIVRYVWEVGGERHEGATLVHAFERGGDHAIALTVTDDDGARETLLGFYRLGGDAGPGDPEDPTVPDPGDPESPDDEPVDPDEPGDPTDPDDPDDPAGPTDPTDPGDPADPTDPVEPTDPEDPVDPPTVPEDGFAIDFRFYGSSLPSEAQRRVFADAADRWADVITGDLPDVDVDLPPNDCFGIGEPAYRGVIDDVLIFAAVVPIDGAGGVLASAGACILRDASGLPLVGLMEFDEADFASLADRGMLFDTVLHEMGHVLGIGTLWEAAGRDLIDSDGPYCDAADVDARFTGAEAVHQHGAIGGVGLPRVETDGGRGTACGHWDEVAFAGELMTGWIGGGMELSALTVGSLADLGYRVDAGAADPYRVPTAGLRSQATGEPLNEVLLAPRRTIE